MNEELRAKVIESFELIKTKGDFESKLDAYSSSESPFRFEAIELLKNSFPQFNKNINIEALKQIEEGQADISDLKGN